MAKTKTPASSKAEDQSSGQGTVRAVERAFDILGCFSTEQRTITLTEAARAVNLPLSTTSRMMATLEGSQFVRRLPDGRYMPGGRLLRIGVVALHGVELYDIAEEYLERLSDCTGEGINLAIPTSRGEVLYLRQVPSKHSVRHDNWIGKSVPMEGTAVGEAIRGVLNAQGYAHRTATLEPDVVAIAAPVRNAENECIAALSITTPSYRVTEDFIARASVALLAEANAMSAQLGAPDCDPETRPRRPKTAHGTNTNIG